MKMDQLCRAHPSWCQGRRGLGRRFFGGRRKDDGSGTIKISKLSTQPLNSLFSTLGRIFGALLLLWKALARWKKKMAKVDEQTEKFFVSTQENIATVQGNQWTRQRAAFVKIHCWKSTVVQHLRGQWTAGSVLQKSCLPPRHIQTSHNSTMHCTADFQTLCAKVHWWWRMDTVQCTVVQDTVGDTEMAGVDAEQEEGKEGEGVGREGDYRIDLRETNSW